MTQVKQHAGNSRWRSVALPIEHGGWGFITEPIVLGLVLAPGWGGLALSVAALGAFLLRQPLKVYFKDWRHQRKVPRTALARQFVLIYGAITLVAGVIALLFVPSPLALLPALMVLPFIGLQLFADVRNQSRALFAELIGAQAPAAIASMIVLMSGWELLLALGLWLALGVKSITAVLYVRDRLRLERGQKAAWVPVIFAHASGLLIILVAVNNAVLPQLVILAMLLLCLRAIYGLSPFRKPQPPKMIGIQELIYGFMFVLAIVIGYAFA